MLPLVKTLGSSNTINRAKRLRNLHTDYYGIWRKLFLFFFPLSPFFDGWQAERPVARSMLIGFGRMNEVAVSWRLGAKNTKPMPRNFGEGQGRAKQNGTIIGLDAKRHDLAKLCGDPNPSCPPIHPPTPQQAQ